MSEEKTVKCGVSLEPIIDRQNPISICDLFTVQVSPQNLIRISTFALTNTLQQEFRKALELAEKNQNIETLTVPATSVIQLTEEIAMELMVHIGGNLEGNDFLKRLQKKKYKELKEKVEAFANYLESVSEE